MDAPHSAEQDFRSDAGNVCRFGVRQLQRTYRTENFSLRDCGGCREGEAGRMRAYKKIPVITDFTDEDGNDRMKETVQANYRRIKEEVKQIVQEELERIAGDDNLKYLLQQK